MEHQEKVLVIDANLTYVSGFLYHIDDDQMELSDQWRIRRTVDLNQLAQAIQFRFKGKYDRVEVVNDRSVWFGNALKGVFPEGLTLGVMIEGDHTIVGATSFGRVFNVKKHEVGITQALDVTLSTEALQFLVNWLKIINREEEINRIINYLGNRRQYPGFQIISDESNQVMLGVLRVILQQVHPGKELFGGGAAGFSKGVHRIIVSGDFAREVSDFGGIMLGIIDGFELEGVWEIYLDTAGVLCSLGFSSSAKKVVHEDVGIVPLGSIIVPTHFYKWGESMGEMKIDLGLSEDPVLDLKSGEVVRLPMEKDVKGNLSLSVKKEIAIPGYEEVNGISGGEIGLLVDLRGQSLPDIADTAMYRKYYRHWREALAL